MAPIGVQAFAVIGQPPHAGGVMAVDNPQIVCVEVHSALENNVVAIRRDRGVANIFIVECGNGCRLSGGHIVFQQQVI